MRSWWCKRRADRALIASALLFSALLASACGDDDEPDGGSNDSGSGVASNKPLSGLESSERRLFCDWAAAKLGGYGYKADCPDRDRAVWAAPDLQTCLDSIPTQCDVQVGAIEACLGAISKDPCAGQAIMKQSVCESYASCAH